MPGRRPRQRCPLRLRRPRYLRHRRIRRPCHPSPLRRRPRRPRPRWLRSSRNCRASRRYPTLSRCRSWSPSSCPASRRPHCTLRRAAPHTRGRRKKRISGGVRASATHSTIAYSTAIVERSLPKLPSSLGNFIARGSASGRQRSPRPRGARGRTAVPPAHLVFGSAPDGPRLVRLGPTLRARPGPVFASDRAIDGSCATRYARRRGRRRPRRLAPNALIALAAARTHLRSPRQHRPCV